VRGEEREIVRGIGGASRVTGKAIVRERGGEEFDEKKDM